MAGDWECADGFNTSLLGISYVMTWACMFLKLPVTKAIKTAFWFSISFRFFTAFHHRLLPSPHVWGGANPSPGVVSFTYCVSLDAYKGI